MRYLWKTLDLARNSGYEGIVIIGGPDVFDDLSREENEEFTKQFPPPDKQKFPCQWK